MLKRQKTNINPIHKLYLVATPIGNYKDITYRAVETLASSDIIYCEDTRITSRLLAHYNIKTKLKCYHLFNENEVTSTILEDVKKGLIVSIVSDAGMPGISDPGYLAVLKSIEEEINVEIIPGVSASITALVGSGIEPFKFTFIGFLNSNANKREKELNLLKDNELPLILYEAPHRIEKTLELLDKIMPERHIVLARELTKQYEEYLRGTPKEILEVVEEIKGEMVIIISAQSKEEATKDLNSLTIKEHYQYYIDLGHDSKEAMKMVAKDKGVSKSEIYQEIKGKNK